MAELQKTFKGFTAAKIARHMVRDRKNPAAYWVTVGGEDYLIVAHRNSVEMANGSVGSALVLERAERRVMLRWSGKPDTIISSTAVKHG